MGFGLVTDMEDVQSIRHPERVCSRTYTASRDSSSMRPETESDGRPASSDVTRSTTSSVRGPWNTTPWCRSSIAARRIPAPLIGHERLLDAHSLTRPLVHLGRDVGGDLVVAHHPIGVIIRLTLQTTDDVVREDCCRNCGNVLPHQLRRAPPGSCATPWTTPGRQRRSVLHSPHAALPRADAPGGQRLSAAP